MLGKQTGRARIQLADDILTIEGALLCVRQHLAFALTVGRQQGLVEGRRAGLRHTRRSSDICKRGQMQASSRLTALCGDAPHSMSQLHSVFA